MKTLITAILLLSGYASLGQTAEDKTLIEFGKLRSLYVSEEQPAGLAQKQVASAPAALKGAAKFMAQTLTVDNELLTPEYLKLPDEATLKAVYYAHTLSSSQAQTPGFDAPAVLEKLRNSTIARINLVDNYYSMLFLALGNKTKFAKAAVYDFKLGEYGLQDDAEKGVFFLRCMQLHGKSIWGAMNLAKPANTKQALSYIQHYPTFNGQQYYHYTALNFPDFPIYIAGENGLQSFKFYLINKYYDVLLSHYTSLRKEGANNAEIDQLLAGSILKNRELHKYTAKKAELEKLLAEHKL